MRRPLLAAVLMATFSVFPVQSAIPDPDGVCDGDEVASVQCKTIAGPMSTTAKGMVTVGAGFCHIRDPAVPFFCNGGPGTIVGFGGATFGNVFWPPGPRSFAVNVVHDQATCVAATSPPCGFQVDICNDLNQNMICTNAVGPDDLYETAASMGILGTCKDGAKLCANPNEAGWTGCMNDSIFSNWGADQIIVFVGTEEGVSFVPFDVQAAAVVGTFTIWVEDNGPCTIPAAPNKNELSFLWYEKT